MTSQNSDLESLYDPTAVAEDSEEESLAQNFNAATANSSTSGAANSGDAVSNSSTLPVESPPPQPYNRIFILEPVVFLAFLGMYLSGAVYQNQILYQTCIAVFHYNDTDCQPLLGVSRETPEAQRIEDEVQPYVSRILMTRSLIESIVPAFLSLFLGPWSDKFGRRPILLTTFTGYLASYCTLTGLAFICEKFVISPWFFLLASIPTALSGGTCASLTGIYCYISDVTKEKARARRMVLNEAALCAGMMLGSFGSGFIYAATNVVTVFTISTFLIMLALLYTFVYLTESLQPEQIHEGSKIREFFRLSLAKDLVKTCFKRRPNFDRAIIWLTMIYLTVAIYTMEGDNNVTYLFLRKKFEWTLKDYSFFSAARIVVQIVGSIIGLILMRRLLKFSIVTMAMMSIACCVLESTVRATAVYWWEMYFGMLLGMMRGIMGPMSRAILTHIAPATEVGKIMALTTSLEFLSLLGAAPLYTTVYSATLNVYPGAYNFISVGLYLLCFTMVSAIYSIQKSFASTSIYQAIGS